MNVKSILKNLLLTLLIVFVSDWQPAFAMKDYFSMSLKELLSEDVSIASLISLKLSKIPAAITIITREDIEMTPAMNILDLIEVYVPGAMMLNNYAGPPTLKLRGIGQRNYKTILLVNGRPVNQKTFNGSTAEITNWDMNDIEHIEVVRGPSSVTYGPGAIAGVINIITKNAGSMEGFKTGVEYNYTFLASPHHS